MRTLYTVVILLSSLLVGAGFTAAAAARNCNADDEAALLAIKAAFNNSRRFSTWIPSTPCCEWGEGDVECNATTGRVDGLTMSEDTDLSGPIPAAIGELAYLRYLRIHKIPNVSGPIPPALARLSHLEWLTISWTGVSGPVPVFLGSLPVLYSIDLSYNSLSGTVPSSLAALPKLSGIDLGRNQLTGPLPPGLFHKAPKDNAYLMLSHNNLSGDIPADFAGIGFQRLDLSRNQFTGDASVFFGRSKPTSEMNLSRNAFEFDLSKVEFPEGLGLADLSHNMIYGSIPTQVTNLRMLNYFNVSYNRLCAQIPSGGNLGSFDEYCFQHNKCLCGTPLPPCKG